ncbi:hypothetical protein [Schaalia sp. ZJ1691]|uniref:hypothetical protein n=1 Tax=Schaalia sp. ZJ1691 TaxID=2709404 RepID=UPI0013E9ADFC|nr:hypothetical protein [Schaalia sp. ZJ1691]
MRAKAKAVAEEATTYDMAVLAAYIATHPETPTPGDTGTPKPGDARHTFVPCSPAPW